MKNENEHISNNNNIMAKVFEPTSMISKNQKDKLINECNQIFNLYKENNLEMDQISKRINILQNLYEHETKINNYYHSIADGSKSSTYFKTHGINYNDLYILENNTNELTKEQRLKIKINRNTAMILRLEKQLKKVNVNLEKVKVDFITAYKFHLLHKHNY